MLGKCSFLKQTSYLLLVVVPHCKMWVPVVYSPVHPQIHWKQKSNSARQSVKNASSCLSQVQMKSRLTWQLNSSWQTFLFDQESSTWKLGQTTSVKCKRREAIMWWFHHAAPLMKHYTTLTKNSYEARLRGFSQQCSEWSRQMNEATHSLHHNGRYTQ